MELNKAFSLRVKEILKEKKITQYKLAQQTNMYQSTLTDILRCKYKTPNFKNMALIIRELGLSMQDFLILICLIFQNLRLKKINENFY